MSRPRSGKNRCEERLKIYASFCLDFFHPPPIRTHECARRRTPRSNARSASWHRTDQYSLPTRARLCPAADPTRTATCLVRSRPPFVPLAETVPPSANIDTNETASSSPPHSGYRDNAPRSNSPESSEVPRPFASAASLRCNPIDVSNLAPPREADRSTDAAPAPIAPFALDSVSTPPFAPLLSHLGTLRPPYTPIPRATDRITSPTPRR